MKINMNKKEIETYIIKNSKTHITGTQLGFLVQGFELALKMLENNKVNSNENNT